MRRLLATALAGAAATALPALPADAARAPTRAEARLIRAKALQIVPDADRRRVTVTIRVSTVAPRWALARIRPRRGAVVGVVLRRAPRWRVVAFGTRRLGCPMPRRVAVDLLGARQARRGC